MDPYKKYRENLDALAKRFPRQFPMEQDFELAWPDGWNRLVVLVCEQVDQQVPDTMWCQIKEKYGELRMYSIGGPIHVDYSGEGALTELYAPKGINPHVIELVQAATVQSTFVCMWCGAPGKRVQSDRWIVTGCVDCLAKDEVELRAGRST